MGRLQTGKREIQKLLGDGWVREILLEKRLGMELM